MSPLTIELVLTYYGADLTSIRKKPGRWSRVKCPFHDDKVASSSVNLEKDGFHCHACKVFGDPLNVIARYEGFGTPDRPDRKAAGEWAKKTLGADSTKVQHAANGRGAPKRNDAWRDRLPA